MDWRMFIAHNAQALCGDDAYSWADMFDAPPEMWGTPDSFNDMVGMFWGV